MTSAEPVATVPTPQALAISGPRSAVGDRAFSVWQFLEGRDAADALGAMDQAAAADYFAQLGGLLARLHEVAGPHVSRPVLASEGHRSWAGGWPIALPSSRSATGVSARSSMIW